VHIRKLHIAIAVFISLFMSMCIEHFDPPLGDFEDLLVIEGLITNSAEPQKVMISRSSRIDTTHFIPENSANVRIIDDLGNEYQLLQIGDGEYQASSEFQGTTGRTYQLFVTTEKGEIIQSDPVTMLSVPRIDSISWEISSRFNDEGDLMDGVQIYVNTHDPNNETWNYRWQWEETWEFNTRYRSELQWDPNGTVEPRPENIYTCWSTVKSQNIHIGSSDNLATDIISSEPIRYVSSSESNRLNVKYSILVKQYALSESAWYYYKQLGKMNQELGSLFAPQPTPVTGNLINITDPGIPVLGYFDASEVNEKRIFISRKEELGEMQEYSGYKSCFNDILTFFFIPGYTPYVQGYAFERAHNPLRLFYIDVSPIGFYYSTIECSDCRLYGTNKKPVFWE